LLNTLGVKNENGVQVACTERAVCDKLYLDGDEYFDNLRSINWELMGQLNDEVYSNNKTISNFNLCRFELLNLKVQGKYSENIFFPLRWVPRRERVERQRRKLFCPVKNRFLNGVNI